MKTHNKYLVWLLLLLCCFINGGLAGCSFLENAVDIGMHQIESSNDQDAVEEQDSIAVNGNGDSASVKNARMTVHFLDVGQGSAVLVESNGHFMLIDGGDREASSKVVSYLKKQGVKKLDLVVVSHYDSDHLNGVVGALNVFKVGNVIAPDYTADSRVYQSFVSILKEKNLQRITPEPGEQYKIGKAKFTILAPNQKEYSDENNYSVAIRLVNGKNRFVITGDAEKESEYEMLENGQSLSCDVYMAGHHGSANSSSQQFLQAMDPAYTVISAGEDNNYGHPSQETMARLKAAGCKVFRTDEQGTVVAVSNGKKITWNQKPSSTWAYREFGSSTSIAGSSGSKKTESPQEKEEGNYIGNRNSKKFHRNTCSGLPDEKNRVYFESVQEAEAAGYDSCGLCRP